MKRIIYRTLVTAVILSGIAACKSIQSLSKEEKIVLVKDKIDSQKYSFEVRTALPTSGRSVNLTTGGYTLHVNNDSIIAYLPYFGRAYVAPINPSEGGIKFTSTNFNYKSTLNKNGYNINIKTFDTQGKTILNLSIFDNGKGSLTVTDNNRQPISFYGEIMF